LVVFVLYFKLPFHRNQAIGVSLPAERLLIRQF